MFFCPHSGFTFLPDVLYSKREGASPGNAGPQGVAGMAKRGTNRGAQAWKEVDFPYLDQSGRDAAEKLLSVFGLRTVPGFFLPQDVRTPSSYLPEDMRDGFLKEKILYTG